MKVEVIHVITNGTGGRVIQGFAISLRSYVPWKSGFAVSSFESEIHQIMNFGLSAPYMWVSVNASLTC